MNLCELWKLYEADKRILGFSTNTLKAYVLQHKMLISEIGDLDISEVTLQLLKEYLARQSDHRYCLRPDTRMVRRAVLLLGSE